MVGLLLLLVALLLSCTSAPPATTPIPTPAASGPFKTYTDEEAKLSIQYPEGWIVERTVLEGLNAMIFRETVEETAPELIVLSGSDAGRDAAQVLDEALSLVQALGGEAKRDWQVSEAEPVLLGERGGQKLTAEYVHAASDIRHQVYLVGMADGGGYALVADAPLDDWDQNWPIFEAMLQSLRLGTG
jgi:hypothetical protein